MKKLSIIGMILISCLATSGIARAADYCEGVIPIVIDPIGDHLNYRKVLRDAFDNYDDVKYETNGRYELCFSFIIPVNIEIYPNHFIIFPSHPPAKDLDVVISGLRLNREGSITSPLLTINYPYAKVTLVDIEITNASNGLLVEGTEVEIINSKISGDRTVPGTGTGACVNIADSIGARIRGGDISKCATGIALDNAFDSLIGAADAATNDADKVAIHDNGVGIHLLSGDGNTWGYNSIYSNESGVFPDELWKDGIVIDGGANDGIMPPTAKKQTESGGILACEKDESGKIVSRKIEFENVFGEGAISLYKTHRDYEYQGKDYIGECDVGTDGICALTALPSWLNIPDNECGLADLEVVAIFTVDGSSAYTEKLLFDGQASIISIATELPSSAPEAVDSGSSGDGESGGTEGGGLSGGGAAGAAPSCGASLAPDATFSGAAMLHLVWLALPLVFVVQARRKRT